MEEKGEPPVSLPFAAGSVAEADLRLDYCSERHETNHRVFASNWPMLEAWIYDSDQSTGPFETNGPPPPFLIPSSQPPLDSAIPHRLMIDEVGSQLFQAIEFRLTLFLTLIVLLGFFIPVQGMESRDEVDKDQSHWGQSPRLFAIRARLFRGLPSAPVVPGSKERRGHFHVARATHPKSSAPRPSLPGENWHRPSPSKPLASLAPLPESRHPPTVPPYWGGLRGVAVSV